MIAYDLAQSQTSRELNTRGPRILQTVPAGLCSLAYFQGKKRPGVLRGKAASCAEIRQDQRSEGPHRRGAAHRVARPRRRGPNTAKS